VRTKGREGPKGLRCGRDGKGMREKGGNKINVRKGIKKRIKGNIRNKSFPVEFHRTFTLDMQ
jgi:hypothetical protein